MTKLLGLGARRKVLAVAKAIALKNGDDWARLPKDKTAWLKGHGHFAGRFRDSWEPFQSTYLAMAKTAIQTAEEFAP